MCGLLIHFIMKNKANSESVFITEKRKYDRSLLAMSLRKRDIEFNISHGHK